MVVTGDPPPGRGQPATQQFMEDHHTLNPTANLSVQPGQPQRMIL
jgi:hypothetical protein